MKNLKKDVDNYMNEELSEGVEILEEQGAESFIKKYRNLIIGGIVIVVIAALAIVFFVKSSETKSQEASLKLSRILPYMENGQYELALAGDKTIKIRGESLVGLKKIVADYSGTEAGMLAAFNAGICCSNLDKAKEAEEYFEIALNSSSPLIIQGANAGLGGVKESQSKFVTAAEYYVTASEVAVDDDAKARYGLYAGICFEKANKNDQAIARYQEVLNLGANSDISDYAKTGLTRLGIIID
ncbi:MAG: hypothetical protein A2X64_08010 [Ignavibacteria bacterium GWF2_33_9]|nr:MAG: hypothetical protein A2X64_08010 [Ignavibacteria bacterium GWF2_33_9]